MRHSVLEDVRLLIRGGVKLLAVFRRAFSRPPALRPMRPRLVVKPSIGLAQCASPLTLGRVLYIYRAQLGQRVSLAGANMRSSYKTAGPCHLLSTPRGGVTILKVGGTIFLPPTFCIPGGYRKQNIAVFITSIYGVHMLYLQKMELHNGLQWRI